MMEELQALKKELQSRVEEDKTPEKDKKPEEDKKSDEGTGENKDE